MAQIAVAVADGDRAAVVATGGVGLEAGELLASVGETGRGFQLHRHPGLGQPVEIDLDFR